MKLLAGTGSTLKTLPEDLPEAKVVQSFLFGSPVAPVLGLASGFWKFLVSASESDLRHTDPLAKGDSVQRSHEF